MMQGHDVTNETGEARVNLELQNYQAAEAQALDLSQRFPENLDVQRANRLWDVHNMWELDINAENMFRSSANASGGNGFAVDTKLYTPPIDYNWRIFAEEYFAYEAEPFGEGGIHLSGTSAGVEYRGHGLTASLAPTLNYYNSAAIGTSGNDRVGGDFKASYAVNDHWTVGTEEEVFSRDTPLRAINAGVTADSQKLDAIYRVSESRELDMNLEFLNFSDENERGILGATYKERLYTNPYWKVDSITDLTGSQNSLDQNRLYYNPKEDFMGLTGLQVTEILYRHYQTVYDHSLLYTPGAYWQESYGTSFAQVAEYRQSITWNDVLTASAGVVFSRQDYDGDPENNVSIIGNLVYRF